MLKLILVIAICFAGPQLVSLFTKFDLGTALVYIVGFCVGQLSLTIANYRN